METHHFYHLKQQTWKSIPVPVIQKTRKLVCSHREPMPCAHSVCLYSDHRGQQEWWLFTVRTLTRKRIFKAPEVLQLSCLPPLNWDCQWHSGIDLANLHCTVIHTRGSMASASFISNYRTLWASVLSFISILSPHFVIWSSCLIYCISVFEAFVLYGTR